MAAFLKLLVSFPPPGWGAQIDLGKVVLVAVKFHDEGVILVDVDTEDPTDSDCGAGGAMVGVLCQDGEFLPDEGMAIVRPAAFPSAF